MSIIPNLLASADGEEIASVIQTERQYIPKKTWMFDFASGEFVVNSVGAVASIEDPREVLKSIVDKILHDDRYRFLAYDDSYGNEIKAMLAQGYQFEIVEAELERLYKEALEYHPAVKAVSDFKARQGEGDEIHVRFIVHGTSGVDYYVDKEVLE